MGNQKELKEEKKMPEKKFRAGAISATIWKNTGSKDGKEFEYSSVSIERNYLDKDKKWQTTSSMRINDLPKVITVMQKSYDYLVMKKTE